MTFDFLITKDEKICSYTNPVVMKIFPISSSFSLINWRCRNCVYVVTLRKQ